VVLLRTPMGLDDLSVQSRAQHLTMPLSSWKERGLLVEKVALMGRGRVSS